MNILIKVMATMSIHVNSQDIVDIDDIVFHVYGQDIDDDIDIVFHSIHLYRGKKMPLSLP